MQAGGAADPPLQQLTESGYGSRQGENLRTAGRFLALIFGIGLGAAPARAQDYTIYYVRVAVGGSGFSSYYAVRTAIFDSLPGDYNQQLRILLLTAPSDIQQRRLLIEGESYYFFPLCGRPLNRYRPARFTISRFERSIRLRCP